MKHLIFLVGAASLFMIVVTVASTYTNPKQILAETNSSQSATLSQLENKSATKIKIPILIYHYVEIIKDKRDTIRKSLNIHPHILESQIETLTGSGYTPITPSDIMKIQTGQIHVNKPVILSFDDGYGDFYTGVFPILKKYNVHAVAYIVPGFLGNKNYMTWDEVKEISASNLVEIGAHTMYHAALDRQTLSIAQEEIVESKTMLELTLGKRITAFAYPYGRYNSEVENLVKAGDFTSAVTTDAGTNENLDNMFALKRIHQGANIGQSLINKLEY